MKKPLFILEMANNHMGDVAHGLRIVREFKAVVEQHRYFDFAFKLQLRDLETIIHPDYRDRMDIKHLKRFTETKLSRDEFISLVEEIRGCGFVSMCTPFDEASVDEMGKIGFDVYKLASCSFADWPLIEKFVTADKPMVISTGGGTIAEMDSMVVFLQHRKKDFCLLHCVTGYPTKDLELNLGQIDFIRGRYQGVTAGFSSHEEPDSSDPVKLAVAKGAMVFERHVGVATDKYAVNQYSITPEQAHRWLLSAKYAFDVCGRTDERMGFSEAATSGVRPYLRGAFLKRDVAKGTTIKASDCFFCMPNLDNQVLARDASKYTEYVASEDMAANEPLLFDKVEVRDLRGEVFAIIRRAAKMLKDASVAVPSGVDCSISAHYGLERFSEYGLVMIDVLNREYCKKLLVMFPGQAHPPHTHRVKEESFHVLSGDMTVDFDGRVIELCKGDLLTVNRGQRHSFQTKQGVIVEEISTTHMRDDSHYDDPVITNNPRRKIEFSLWLDAFEEK